MDLMDHSRSRLDVTVADDIGPRCRATADDVRGTVHHLGAAPQLVVDRDALRPRVVHRGIDGAGMARADRKAIYL